VLRRALTAKPIASSGASRLSFISTSMGTCGPACLSRLVSCVLIWLSRSAERGGAWIAASWFLSSAMVPKRYIAWRNWSRPACCTRPAR
jgi:hypothetical protein